jgi:hypothetical protein
LLAKVLEEFTSLDVLQDEVQMSGRLPDVVETHDVGMVNELHDNDLALDGEEDSFGLIAGTSG